VCLKRVPAPGARINVTADGQAVDTANLGFTMSPHEECALEAGLALVEAHGGSVTALTLGPVDAEEQLRYAASLGVGAVVLVPIDELDWDPQRTAHGITAAITELEAADGAFDLVVFGNESSDSGGFQVGIRVARAQSRPMVTGAKGIRVDGDMVRVQREVDGVQEVYELPLPAMVGVKEGINLPRYPSLPGRLRAKRAVIERLQPEYCAEGLRKQLLRVPAGQAKRAEVLGTGADAVPAMIRLLEELGVLT
jgi:electron transfer flavoprotein beta subunit